MIADFDLARARSDTPGCESVLHFNNAGAGLMPSPVLDSVLLHLQRESQIGGYEAADERCTRLDGAYDDAARLLNCDRAEIAFIENATRAWDMAFYAIPFKKGDVILTASASYGSNYIAFLQVAKRSGLEIQVIPNDEYGQLSIPALRSMINERTALIAITHMPTNGGLVNPAAQVGEIARDAGVYYLLDACQSVGQMPVDVRKIGCDMLSTTGRKYLRGPRGTGLLYVRRSALEKLEPPMLDLHAATWVGFDSFEIRQDARRFENWEFYVAGRLGLGEAIRYALEWGLEPIWHRVQTLAAQLRRLLAEIPGVTVRDLGREQSGIVTFTVEGQEPKSVRRKLARHRINVTTTTVRSTRLDMEQRQLAEMVRASVHYYNSEEEVERFAGAVKSLIG
jgi:selenocysteine lyase/cysteine desulfurase